MNKSIESLLGEPCNLSEGKHVRSDNEASNAPKTRSLGKGKFLPDTEGLSYGTGGVDISSTAGRSGPTGKA